MRELLAQWLSIREIASLLGLSKSAVHRFKQAEQPQTASGYQPRPAVSPLGSVSAGQALDCTPCVRHGIRDRLR